MRILIVGATCIDINVNVDSFPIHYDSFNFIDNKTNISIGGAGYNVCKTLDTIGSSIDFLTHIGNDISSLIVKEELKKLKCKTLLYDRDAETITAIVFYDSNGNRKILRDGKFDREFNLDSSFIEQFTSKCNIAILAINSFTKKLIPYLIKDNIPICVDIQQVHNIYDKYAEEYRNNADILFFSNDESQTEIKDINYLLKTTKVKIVCCSMGSKGLYLAIRNDKIYYYEAIDVKPVNTTGAGDTLFSTFIYYYYKTKDPHISIKKALTHVSNKIKNISSNKGLLSENEIDKLYINLFT